ncbi:hypothetical protein KP509_02G078800 [Ceratopteris richardii]|uniref:Uncharacterized protein n=1 Tax=Ceratopteris richardii TaxID=49495 RepID=A0A8T2VAP1_CERRI|nr:hypothetical protein KP509_02G078800 [Ceratopteris richardii]KAH7444452.1 hypothetical protein KP509_02G078800 [Ceratopteris richardii]
MEVRREREGERDVFVVVVITQRERESVVFVVLLIIIWKYRERCLYTRNRHDDKGENRFACFMESAASTSKTTSAERAKIIKRQRATVEGRGLTRMLFGRSLLLVFCGCML